MPNDIGKFVGRWFQVQAGLSVVAMYVSGIFFDSMNVDFSVILMFWLGHCLVGHHPLARKWAIAICILVLVTNIALIAYAGVAGTDQMTLRIGSMKLDRPSFSFLIGLGCVEVVLMGLPLWLLLTPQAKREFMSRPEDSQIVASKDPVA